MYSVCFQRLSEKAPGENIDQVSRITLYLIAYGSTRMNDEGSNDPKNLGF